MRVLGIESSCDETAAAVVEYTDGRFSVLASVVASQVATHAKTGGVVPEVAARAHVEAIIPTIREALNQAASRLHLEVAPPEVAPREVVDVVAVTHGPGLITSLRVGVDTARILAHQWGKPLVAVNHLEGHIYACLLSFPLPRGEGRGEGGRHPHLNFTSPPLRGRGKVRGTASLEDDKIFEFPALALIVSGGHTELVLMKKHIDYTIIGATRDDAAGEAFDKVAKILGLGYPGGPAVSKCAEKGNASAIAFPRPMIDSDNFDFSFAGLKTSVLYHMRDRESYQKMDGRPKSDNIQRYVVEVCASFEQAVTDVLVSKTIRAAKKYRVKTVILGGGVAANKRLREELGRAIKQQLPTTYYLLPTLEYTGDNAAMIAAAGALHASAKDFTPWEKIDVDPNLSL